MALCARIAARTLCSLGEALDAVRAALLELGGPELAERIELRRARLGEEPGQAGVVTAVPRARN